MTLALYCFANCSLTGCGSPSSSQQAVLKCLVSIDGLPAQDVRVVLKSQANAAVTTELEGVTDHLGIADLHLVDGSQLPATEMIELRAAVESLGDWHIIQPWSDIERSPLVMKWTVGEEQIRIDLPKKSVKAL